MSSNRRRLRGIALGAVAFEAASAWLFSRRLGGRLVVRCADGHLFTTIWVPGGSLKALRLGAWRFQHCPVGGHWTVVRPVNEGTLTDEQRREAREHRDIPIP